MAIKWLLSLVCLTLAERVHEGMELVQLNRGGDKIEAAEGKTAAREQLLAMKDTLLGLMEAPASSLPVLEQIATLLNTSFIHIYLTERSNDETQHNALLNNAQMYGEDYDTAIEDSAGLWDELTEARDLHYACRQDQGRLNKGFELCKGAEVTLQQDYQMDRQQMDTTAGSIGCTDDPDSDIWLELERLDTNWDSLSSGLTATVSAVYELKVQEEDCAAQRIVLDDKIAECNGEDDGQVSAACDYSTEVLAAVTSYTNSFNFDRGEFESLKPIWQDESLDRSTQCQLIKLLQCYVNTLVTHDDAQPLNTAVGVCDEQYATTSYNCSEVEFVPGDWPKAREMANITATCHDAAWDYGFVFPLDTQSIECPSCERPDLPDYVVVESAAVESAAEDVPEAPEAPEGGPVAPEGLVGPGVALEGPPGGAMSPQ